MRQLPIPSLSVGILLVAATVGIVIPALVAQSIYDQRAQAIRSAEINAENTARALEQHATRTFEAIDAYLQAVISLIGAGLDNLPPAVVHQALLDKRAQSRHVHNLLILDANGDAVHEAASFPIKPRNRRHRDYFASLRDQPNAGLYVGRPITDDSGLTTIPVARRINKRDGAFGGVIVAALDPAVFQAVYDSLDLGKAATLTLWRSDGLLLVRAPCAADLIGKSFAASDHFKRHLAAGHDQPFWAKGATDGVERVIAYRHPESYPFYVSAALARDAVLAPWQRSAWRQAGIAGGLTVVLVVALALFAREASHRQQANAQTRESEERYRVLAESTTDMVVRISLDGVREYVSPASRALLGYEPNELVGQRPVEITHPDDREPLLKQVTAVLSGEVGRNSATYRLRHREGHWLWVEANFQAIRGPDGKSIGLISAVRDVTERRAQAEELRSAKEIAELHLARAEHASQAKADFLAVMSHEIRTPLNSIIGFTDLLLSRPQTPENQHQLELVRGAGAALLTVVNDILDYSKIEAGEITLQPQPLSLAALIDNAISIIRGMAASKDLLVRAEIDPHAPQWVEGDGDRLRQVLLNLLNNAVKFTRQGSVTLAVTQEERDERNGEARPDPSRLRFAVTDTGIGIPRDKQDRLFQRFSQVDGSIQREFGGTGLGLAICKRLIELMGGTIGVDSEAGRGSTFWFTVALPVASKPEYVEVSEPTGLSSAFSLARILLVEDLDINQELARAVLEKVGHQVQVVSNGAEAVAAIRNGGPFDIVLMDVQMPVLDGIAATERIRALPGPERHIPIIAMTANVLPEQVARFKRVGMDDHVGKPFRHGELLAAVARWLPDRALVEEQQTLPEETGRSAVLNRVTFDGLVRMLGPEKAAGMLAKLEERLNELLTASDPNRLAADAHSMTSMAGMLGFAELSRLCRELEDVCRASGMVGESLARVRAASASALDAIRVSRERLLAA